MADYSGHYDAYATLFIPDQNRTWYWGSSKSFAGPRTIVPKEYFDYLMELLEEYHRRVGRAEKVTVRVENGNYVLEGLSLSESSDKVRARFDWPNPCKHENRRTSLRGYDVCFDCREIFCGHKEQNLLRRDGEVVGGWTCEACGKEVEAYG